MPREEMKAKMEQYLATVDDLIDEEWYCTRRSRETSALANFFDFLYGEEMAKEQRYAVYLELKAEFEPNQGEQA